MRADIVDKVNNLSHLSPGSNTIAAVRGFTDEGNGLARLRLFYVEPFARRRSIGDALVRTCVAFARDAGYGAITLWTHTILESARRIYAVHGFELIESALHHEFGQPVQGETWRLALAGSACDDPAMQGPLEPYG